MKLTTLPVGPACPPAPGGPISVRLLMGQPWEHLARIDWAYCEIWAVTTPLQSCRTCSSVRPGPCGTQTTWFSSSASLIQNTTLTRQATAV